jgi:hypothetical protein
MKNADAAMYRAKSQGKDAFVFYTREAGLTAPGAPSRRGRDDQ